MSLDDECLQVSSFDLSRAEPSEYFGFLLMHGFITRLDSIDVDLDYVFSIRGSVFNTPCNSLDGPIMLRIILVSFCPVLCFA